MAKGKFAADTQVSPDHSMAEIRTILRRYGATKLAVIEEANSIGVMFEIANRRIRFQCDLPTRSETALDALGRKQGAVKADQAYEKATRQRWRALVLVIKAKLESVDSQIETVEEAFMAQIVIPGDNRTVSQWLAPQLEAAYSGNPQPFLLPSGGSRVP